MSDPVETSRNQRELARQTDFAELASRIVDDLAKILRSEIRLFDASLRKTLESQTDRVLGALFLLVTLIYGSLCLVGGVILLLHIWLEWWLALGITGLAIIIAGGIFKMAMRKKAEQVSV
ncbi:MAG: phage holin family protein [Candidatus Binataceae bacterium]